jgi:formylglycine-generating enzyme required for sulfatase activity
MNRRAHGNALPEGFRLHWYRIGGVLGQGGFGITYLATDTNLDKAVAIKEYVPIELAVRESGVSVHPFTEDRKQSYLWGLQRFLSEARTLAKFVHPNIVRVFAVFEVNNTAYMVMEYEQGDCLEDLIKFDRIGGEANLLRIVHPILDGLEYIHEAGFIHRDIKPDNIYVRGDGSPVLLDFGSARMALGGQTRTLTSVVSPGYAPYEQYHAQEGKQGPWTDIYGLGATMYAALNRGQGPLDALVRSNARIENKPDPLVPAGSITHGRYSTKLLEAIDAALVFMPQERPQSIAAWRNMLPALGETPEVQDMATQRAPAAATRPSSPAPFGVRWRSRRVHTVTIAIVTVAAVVIGAWGYLQQQRELATQAVAEQQAVKAAAEQRAREQAAQAAAEQRAREQAAQAAAEQRAREQAALIVRDTLKDGSLGPQMVRITAGRFVMGSPSKEAGRDDAEGPQHQVTIAADFALGKFPVTVGEFRRFVDATQFRTAAENIGGCFSSQGKIDGATWRDGKFKRPLSDRHPVVCVTWNEARAYAEWLSSQSKAIYRVPSEAEWEYAARAGSVTSRFWGDDPAAACRYANVGDVVRSSRGNRISGTAHDCSDNFNGPAPVGKFEANAFGLYDMLGNVRELTADCWRGSYVGAAADGSPVNDGNCKQHVTRGGNFSAGSEEIRSAARHRKGPRPAIAVGFRVARDL